MAVGSADEPAMFPIAGVRLSAVCASIKKAQRRDVVLIELAANSTCAAVFTRNAFCAAPVSVARDHLRAGMPRFLLINSGNANAGLGAQGIRDAMSCCTELGALAGCEAHAVLPFSTGVIGEPLPVAKITSVLPAALQALHADGWDDAAHGIMTTDTVPKGASRQIVIADQQVTVTGIAKGSGMIRPDMATMLAFVTTDARVSTAALQQCLEHAVSRSFNRITVDGDTSTNDACVLAATGAVDQPVIEPSSGGAFDALCAAVAEVCSDLARAIVRDGEGATRVMAVRVTGGRDVRECESVAYAVAESPLVKTALFAADPNWGRILAAVGRAGLQKLDLERTVIHLDEVCIVRGGARAPEYQEAQGRDVMQRDELTVHIELGRGAAQAEVLTCDLSYDYVRINAEYRT